MGLEVLDAVDAGGTWTVPGHGDTAPPAPPKPAAPTTSSMLAERPARPMPAPNPVAPVPPVVVARPPAAADPVGSGRPGGGRWLIAAAIVVGLAVAVPLAVGAGTFAYRVTNAPMPRAGSAPSRYLADASSTRVEAAAVSRGLQCGTPPQDVGLGTALVRVCQRVSGRRVASVAMGGRDPGHLIVVTASVGGEPADEPTDLALLQAIVDTTVARRDAAADNAWLSAHFDQSGDSQTIANGVLLRLTVHDPVRSLAIVRAPG
jgi:hypothetical protein